MCFPVDTDPSLFRSIALRNGVREIVTEFEPFLSEFRKYLSTDPRVSIADYTPCQASLLLSQHGCSCSLTGAKGPLKECNHEALPNPAGGFVPAGEHFPKFWLIVREQIVSKVAHRLSKSGRSLAPGAQASRSPGAQASRSGALTALSSASVELR